MSIVAKRGRDEREARTDSRQSRQPVIIFRRVELSRESVPRTRRGRDTKNEKNRGENWKIQNQSADRGERKKYKMGIELRFVALDS